MISSCLNFSFQNKKREWLPSPARENSFTYSNRAIIAIATIPRPKFVGGENIANTTVKREYLL